MYLKLNKLSKMLGLEILNLDLKKVIDKKLKIKLNDLFVKNKVLVIRKQFMNPNKFQRAAKNFGKIFREIVQLMYQLFKYIIKKLIK